MNYPQRLDPLSVILKLPGETCNINCSYCYEKRSPKLGIKKMEISTIQKFLNLAGGSPLAVELHGGEPLLAGKNTFKEILKLLEGYNGPIEVTLQTNATLIDREWAEILTGYDVNMAISISLDGDQTANQFRLSYANKETINKVEEGLRVLHESGISTGVACTVTKLSLERGPQILEYFASLPTVRHVKFNPCFDYDVSLENEYRAGSGIPIWSITPMEFEGFLEDVFLYWKKGLYETVTIDPVMSVIRAVDGRDNNFCVYSEKKCAHVLTLYPNGDLTSCDELNANDSRLANVNELSTLDEVRSLKSNQKLKEGLQEILEDCSECDYYNVCKGGCLATRKRYKGSRYYEEYCLYKKKLIDFVREEV